jgi:hypothetical protein
MRWPWGRRGELCEPRIWANSEIMELETAKEILAEIFQARPADVEDMIQSRLEEKCWNTEEKLWPATFCLGE